MTEKWYMTLLNKLLQLKLQKLLNHKQNKGLEELVELNQVYVIDCILKIFMKMK